MIKATYKLFLILMLSLLAFSPCYGTSDTTGTQSGDYLKLNRGTRAASLGDTFIAIANDPSAIYWNPAGLNRIKETEISSTYMSWLAGISTANLSFVRPYGEHTIGLSVDYINIGGFEETTLSQPAGTGNIISPVDYVLNFSLAQKLANGPYFGVNIKSINENIGGAHANGYGADLGLFWNYAKDINLGFNARNLIGSLGGSSVASNYGVGASWDIFPFLFAADCNYPNDNNPSINLGMEYNHKNILFGRIGLNSRSEENSGGSLGVGVGLKLGNNCVDYAYVPYGDLGATHRLSLLVVPFGVSKLSDIIIYYDKRYIKAGEEVIFKASGFDTQGYRLDLSPSWEVVGGIAKIDQQKGSFIFSDIGSAEVIAKANGIKGSTKVIVMPGNPKGIFISPVNPEIKLGQTLQFICEGYDEYGNLFEVFPEWSTTGKKGTITNKGLFETYLSVGQEEVFAKIDNISTKVNVTVIP